MSQYLQERLAGLPSAGALEWRCDGLWMNAPTLDVQALARLMEERSGRLSTITALAREDGESDMIYHFVVDHVALNVKTRTRGGALPSIAGIHLAANWIEREIHDLYAVEFPGHPNLERLVRPAELPAGLFRQG